MIRIKHLSKSYGSKAVLQDVQLQLEQGKVYGIVGENGSGKTTLFRCLAGLESHFGEIESDYDSLKDHMGFLATNPYFFPKITGREYLQLLCNARKLPEDKFDLKNIFDLPLEEYAVNYSTGMKKKLAMTGILLQQNDFFILDEPFNGVDIQSNIILTEIIHQLRSLKKTILISSHIFSTLRTSCDEIHVLKEGHFIKKVLKDKFNELEKEMKAISIGDRLTNLALK